MTCSHDYGGDCVVIAVVGLLPAAKNLEELQASLSNLSQSELRTLESVATFLGGSLDTSLLIGTLPDLIAAKRNLEADC